MSPIHDINQSDSFWHICQRYYGHDDSYTSKLYCESLDKGFCYASSTKWMLVWFRSTAKRIIAIYMNSPIFLVVCPMLFGVVIGWLLASLKATRQRQIQSASASLRTLIESHARKIIHIGVLLLRRLFNLSQFVPSLKSPSLNAEEVSHHRMQSELHDKEKALRKSKYSSDAQFEAGVPKEILPKHIAVIMDGNRRYGLARYGIASKGHWDGSSKLCDFAKWCQSEGIKVLSVYAFSTENWSRDKREIDELMQIILNYCDEIRVEAIERNMQVKILSTNSEPIPVDVRRAIHKLEEETATCTSFRLNICLSYGSRGEIVNACQSVVNAAIQQCKRSGEMDNYEVTETEISKHLLLSPNAAPNMQTSVNCDEGFASDPDILIRTSGEMRISNFLLWQLAYTEFFFLPCQWPEIQKADLINVIQSFARGRQRRFGK